MHIRVHGWTDHDGTNAMEGLHLDGRYVAVVGILDQWYGPNYRYVKVEGDDGAQYILRFDEVARRWELTMFTSKRAQGISSSLT